MTLSKCHGKTFLNLFYNLKILKESRNSSLEEKVKA